MIEKIKEIVDKDKNDNETHLEYIKAFCNSKKAEELFENNDEFKELKESVEEKIEE